MAERHKELKTALLIVDMQIFFQDIALAPTTNITILHDYFASKSWPIIFTKHGHPAWELTIPSTNQLVNKWGIEGCLARGSPGEDLVPAMAKLQTASKAQIVQKSTYDAFLGTNLDELLKESRVRRVVVVGVLTDACCKTSVMSSFNRGYDTWLVSDATGTATQEQHDMGLKSYGFAYGETPTTKETLQWLGADND